MYNNKHRIEFNREVVRKKLVILKLVRFSKKTHKMSTLRTQSAKSFYQSTAVKAKGNADKKRTNKFMG